MLSKVLGYKHSTEPPVVVESLSMTTDEVGPDDETQEFGSQMQQMYLAQ